MARIIDQVIQTEIMAGINVQYAGSGKNARADLASTDYLKVAIFVMLIQNLLLLGSQLSEDTTSV